MDADDERDLERWLALYRDACTAAGVDPLRTTKRANWRAGFTIY
jgi:hypothetical protein